MRLQNYPSNMSLRLWNLCQRIKTRQCTSNLMTISWLVKAVINKVTKWAFKGRFPVRCMKYTHWKYTYFLTSSIAPGESHCSKHLTFTNVLKTHFLGVHNVLGICIYFQICNFLSSWQPLSKIGLISICW